MPETVKVRKDELLKAIRANRDGHREKFLAALEGYRARVIQELDRTLKDAKAGRDVVLAFHLPKPEDHTEDYDREIRMLEMHVKDEIEIDSRLFDQVVMDRWHWSAAFAGTNAMYVSGK